MWLIHQVHASFVGGTVSSQDNLHGIGRACIAEFRLNYATTTEIHVALKFMYVGLSGRCTIICCTGSRMMNAQIYEICYTRDDCLTCLFSLSSNDRYKHSLIQLPDMLVLYFHRINKRSKKALRYQIFRVFSLRSGNLTICL